MNRQRFIMLVVVAVLVISGALYLNAQRNQQRQTSGAALLPGLANELNTVTTVTLRHGSTTPTLTLHEQSGHWTVTERGDYPADVGKLRKLLLTLADASLIEEKTSVTTSFPIIGVEDPSLPTASGTEISIAAQDGKHAVIIGKSVGAGNFVRRVGEQTSYIAEPSISFETEPRFWIDSPLLNIPTTSIQSIEIKPAAEPSYTTRRTTASSDSFILDGVVPRGRKVVDTALLAPSPTMLSGLAASDVTRLGEIDFSKATTAMINLSDGNVITMSGVTIGDKHWVRLTASKDAALNAKAEGRAFDIASYRFDAIFRPLEQLLVPIPPPSDSKKDSPSKKPSAAPKS